MKITVDLGPFATELRLLTKIVPAKPAVAITGCVLIETRAAELSMRATDLDVTLTTTCAAVVHEPGSVALQADKLVALVERFEHPQITITTSRTAALIECGAFKTKIQVPNADDFPASSSPSEEATNVVLDGSTLQLMTAMVRHAVSLTSPTMILRGANLTVTDQAMTLAATDGKRLSVVARTPKHGHKLDVTLSAKVMDWLGDHADGDVALSLDGNHIFLSNGKRTLASRVFEGTFPAYARIIPRDNDVDLTCNRTAFASALRRVLMVTEKNKAVYLVLGNGQASLTATAAGFGSAEEPVQVSYAGPDWKVCVNGEFLLDFLESAVNDEIKLQLKAPENPLLFVDGVGHLEVIMPLRP